MSRVEAKIKVGSRVMWAETQSGTAPSPWVAKIVASGTVKGFIQQGGSSVLGPSSALIHGITIHAIDLESERGVGVDVRLQMPQAGYIEMSRLKSLDDMRYKK